MNCCKKLPSFANLFEEGPWSLKELLELIKKKNPTDDILEKMKTTFFTIKKQS